MLYTHFTTKEDLIARLGLSKSTFYRRMKALNIQTSRKLISPDEVERICRALGYTSLPPDARPTQPDTK